MKTTRRVLLSAVFLLLGGCASIALSTLWKLRGIGIDIGKPPMGKPGRYKSWAAPPATSA